MSELIHQSNKSAQTLVLLLSSNFSSFCDTATYKDRPGRGLFVTWIWKGVLLTQYCSLIVAFLKRAQIFAADVWNRFGGHGYGEFHDIDSLTMFADYRYVSLSLSLSPPPPLLSSSRALTLSLCSRVPQTLLYLEVLVYEPALLDKLKQGVHLESASQEEVEIRGCSIWAVDVSQSCCTIIICLKNLIVGSDRSKVSACCANSIVGYPL